MNIGKSLMRTKWLVFTFGLFVSAKVAAAAPPNSCTLPQGLDAKVATKYPRAHIVGLADLNEDDRNLYKKGHGLRCPGLVEVNFYGDDKPTWALVLMSSEDPTQIKSELLVARKLELDWDIHSLSVATGIPVVWRQNPGKYKDIYGQKAIQATRPVVVLCYYNSSAVIFAWNGKKIEKVWLSD